MSHRVGQCELIITQCRIGEKKTPCQNHLGPQSCMCGHSHDVVLYSRFHLNLFRGIEAIGGRILSFSCTLANGFCDSLYKPWSLYRVNKGAHRLAVFVFKLISMTSQSNENYFWLVTSWWRIRSNLEVIITWQLLIKTLWCVYPISMKNATDWWWGLGDPGSHNGESVSDNYVLIGSCYKIIGIIIKYK